MIGALVSADSSGSALARGRRVKDQTGTALWGQEVVDEKGRRRFHGAFTGRVFCAVFGCL